MHRPLGRSGSDHRVVRETLADGVHVSRSSPASGIRDRKALVGDSREAHGPGALGSIVRGDALRSPREGTNAGIGAEGGLVRQGVSDLLRCFGVGQKGVVGTAREDFLRVGAGKRHDKSPAGVHGKANQRGLLCSVMAKVQLSGQEISRASSVLANSGLNLGAQNKVANNTIPEGQIIEQSLRPGTEVEAGSSVSITVSSGAQKASRSTPPDHQVGGLTDRTERARSLLLALTGSWWAMALRGLVIVSFGLAGLVLQEGTFQFRLSYALMIIADGAIAWIDGTTRADHRRLLLIQGGTSIVVGLLVLVVWLVNTPLVSNYAYTDRDIFHHFAVAPRLIGSWAILIGITRIIAAPQLRWDTKILWLMGTSGVSLVVFGIPLLLRVDPTWRPLSFLLLVSGIALIAVASRARDR